jgi:hypothetical protein
VAQRPTHRLNGRPTHRLNGQPSARRVARVSISKPRSQPASCPCNTLSSRPWRRGAEGPVLRNRGIPGVCKTCPRRYLNRVTAVKRQNGMRQEGKLSAFTNPSESMTSRSHIEAVDWIKQRSEQYCTAWEIAESYSVRGG